MGVADKPHVGNMGVSAASLHCICHFEGSGEKIYSFRYIFRYVKLIPLKPISTLYLVSKKDDSCACDKEWILDSSAPDNKLH